MKKMFLLILTLCIVLILCGCNEAAKTIITPAPTPSASPTPAPTIKITRRIITSTMIPAPTPSPEQAIKPTNNAPQNNFLTDLNNMHYRFYDKILAFMDYIKPLTDGRGILRDEEWVQTAIRLANDVKTVGQEILNYSTAPPNEYVQPFNEYKAGCSLIIESMDKHIDCFNRRGYEGTIDAIDTFIEGNNKIREARKQLSPE